MDEQQPTVSLSNNVFSLLGFQPNVDLLLAAFRTEDDLAKVLRVHLAVERQIDVLIEAVTTIKVDRRMSFYSKTVILRAMRVSAHVCNAIDAINDLRNKFAHNHAASMNNTKSISDRVIAETEAVLTTLRTFKIRLTARGREEMYEFESLNRAQQVVVVGAILSAFVGGMASTHKFADPTPVVTPKGVNW